MSNNAQPSAENRAFKNVLVTGGSGFIGVNFIRHLLGSEGFSGRVVNFDVLSYAANPMSLKEYEDKDDGRYVFVRGDIRERSAVEAVMKQYDIDTIVHFAAESHVDRSILGPEAFITTNVMGTFTLLDVARHAWKDRDDVLFHHISTDEVFGSLGDTGYFTETTAYDPRSPYSSSKAGSDHLVRAYYHTYSLPITLSNCSNNYGPYQFPEKLIPIMIMNMLEGKPLPVYGDGKNVRDWLYVEDHASAIWMIMKSAQAGASYNVGGENEWENIKLLHRLIEIVAAKTGKDAEAIRSTISYVTDRPGHDRRYAIDCSAIKNDLGWKQSVSFDQGLEKTVDWYLSNEDWIQSIRSGEYQKWIADNYSAR